MTHVGHAKRAEHLLFGQICQRIGAGGLADLFNGLVRGDQLGAVAGVDAVEAGVCHGWRADAHMHFTRARVADQAHEASTGGAPHDGVVHDDHALALDHLADGVELEMDTVLALLVARLDEGAPDVAVLDEADLIGDAGFFRVANGR